MRCTAAERYVPLQNAIYFCWTEFTAAERETFDSGIRRTAVEGDVRLLDEHKCDCCGRDILLPGRQRRAPHLARGRAARIRATQRAVSRL